MKSSLALLQEHIKINGLIKTASLLQHDDTTRIKRWIRENEIPKIQEPGVVAILKMEIKK
jgi:hypothetical protein